MPEQQLIAVSLRGSGTPLLAEAIEALGYTPYGTMSATQPVSGEPVGAGEVYPLLEAAHGAGRAAELLRGGREELAESFDTTVHALWRVWWRLLGQPVTLASPVDAALEERLLRVPGTDLVRLLPGRGCWYVNSLDLGRADADVLRVWSTGGGPPLVFHHRDVRDRIISHIEYLMQPTDRIGSQPEDLVYQGILRALPDMDARVALALSDPDFPGIRDARRCRWMLHHPAVHVVTHEDLAGPALGGSPEARESALARLRHATGHPEPAVSIPVPAPAADAAYDSLAIGSWRTYFTPGHERLLRENCHDLLLAPTSDTNV
ncbi:hypothetical protein [Streptomyces sp. NPDC001568]|uniref:hypothetical protein n=1 Tax=Streptomyces sp. NPDC001568 TaxID=3364588 RepID=UPI0036A90274